jgi:peroxin-3
MLDGLRTYFYERRRGIATTAGVFGALYLTGQYVLDRLEDMREQVMQSQRDREK